MSDRSLLTTALVAAQLPENVPEARMLRLGGARPRGAGDCVRAADVKLGDGGQISAQPLTTNLARHVVHQRGRRRRPVRGEDRQVARRHGTDDREAQGSRHRYFTDVEELAGNNTALGVIALLGNTTGGSNTAVGVDALQRNTTGSGNTALGVEALAFNTEGLGNTATGVQALWNNTTGSHNVALGSLALSDNTTGFNNTAIGAGAGFMLTTGNNNIHINNIGTAADDALIRIGTVGTQTAAFIAGIRGVTTGVADALAVLIDSTGQLGTTMVLDKDGQPSGVRYDVLPAMLLNELQRQQRQLAAHVTREREETARLDTQAARLDAQQQELDELRAQVRALIKERAVIVERNVDPERR
jgi:hypothetical protein